MSHFARILLVCLAILMALLPIQAQAQVKDRLIMAGEKVRVSCEEEPALSRDYTITRDGLIVMSFIGAVKVSGLTTTEAAQRISDQLLIQRVLRRATISVTFTDESALPIRFVGAVKTASEVAHKDGMRLSDAMALAEPTPTADLSKVELTNQAGRTRVINFAKSKGKDDDDNNPPLNPGDKILVPQIIRSGNVMILGGVARPGVQAFVEGLSARAAILAAGGYDGMGNSKKVRLEREKAQPTNHDMSVDEYDFPLQPGDRLIVELNPVKRYVVLVGQVGKPGIIVFKDGLTLTQAIELAGGIPQGLTVKSVKIFEPKGRSGDKLRGTYDLEKIQAGRMGDIKLNPGDRVEVGKLTRKDRESFRVPLGSGGSPK